MDFDFKQFRKYYDTYGGVYQGHADSLNRDLYLDIGHIGFEAGITMPDLPNVSVYYDHDYKSGSKSMLNWSADAQAGSKKIAPSWEEIDEVTDTFGMKGDYTEKGYHLTGDQRWDISHWKTRGYEQAISATGGAGDQHVQDQVQETNVMTTTLGADKWYLGDKVFGSSAYRFEHLKNQDRENFSNHTGAGVPLTDDRQNHFNATAHNEQDLNSWVLNLMVSPWNWLSGTGGFKAEASQQDSGSFYPLDRDGTTNDSLLKNNTDSNTYKFAESFGLRFKAIPRAVVYSDLSFEQSENHQIENQFNLLTASKSPVGRDTTIREPAATWATGVDYQPLRFVNLTSQFRLQDKEMNFNDARVVGSTSSTDGLNFMKWMHARGLGFTQRATVHLSSWAQTSFRYLYDDTNYDNFAVDNNASEKARMLSNTFIYDVSVYPLSNLSMTGSVSQQYAETKTIAAAFPPGTPQIPVFDSNYLTWMFATDYQPHKKVRLDGSLFYTVAENNGGGIATNLVNYASAFDQMGLTVGCKWEISKDLSITPRYGFQRYMPSVKSGIGGGYDAQIVSLALTSSWG